MVSTETLSGVTAGAAAGATTVLLGAQADALVVGLMAAVFVSIWLESIDSRVKAASAVLFAAMLAGYGSPVAASWLVGYAPSVAQSADQLRLLLAALIGGGAPALVPISLRALGRRIENGGQK